MLHSASDRESNTFQLDWTEWFLSLACTLTSRPVYVCVCYVCVCLCVCTLLRYHLSLAWRSQIQCKQNTFSESWALIWNTWWRKTTGYCLPNMPNMPNMPRQPNTALSRRGTWLGWVSGPPGPYKTVQITEFIWINCYNMIVKRHKNYVALSLF